MAAHSCGYIYLRCSKHAENKVCPGCGTVKMQELEAVAYQQMVKKLEDTLLPTLSKDEITVMDNMWSHHAKAVKRVLDTSGIRYLYLPPYSPDLDPIEKCDQG